MDDLVMVSVAENRARETCVAMMTAAQGATITVFSCSDDHSYSGTLDTLRAVAPQEILISESCRDRVLTKKICRVFRDESGGGQGASSCVAYVARTLFDQDRGAEMLRRVLTEGAIDEDVLSRYIVLAAAHALLKYVEKQSGEHFAAGSVRFRLDPASFERENLVIDRRSALALELVQNSRSGDQATSLFGQVNRTKTSVGARKLRATLLCPSSDAATIEARQDAVQEIVDDEELLQVLLEELAKLPNLDRIANGLCRVPKNVTMKAAENAISTLLGLNHALQLLPLLASRIRSQGVEGLLLRTILGTIDNPDLVATQATIAEILSSDASFRRRADEALDAACFSVKSGYNGTLDVARQALLQSVEDIHAAAESLSAAHGLAITVKYAISGGFQLVIPDPTPSAPAPQLPGVFIQARRQRKNVICSTEAIESLSSRVREATQEVLLLTHALLQGVMDAVREEMDALFAAIDAIALLDLVASFADLVMTAPQPYCRPRLTADGPLVIKAGQHPVAAGHGLAPYVPTDVLTGQFQNFQVVTGPNGAGKTTLLKQVALIVVLAQSGGWVPAEHCILPLRDRILTRMGSADDLENHLSSFHMEMRDAAYMLDHVTARSLVLVDELGRSTSYTEGLAIAWAISEALLATPAFSFFVTHFRPLTELSGLYANAKNIHLKTDLAALDPLDTEANPDADAKDGAVEAFPFRRFKIAYHRNVVEGPSAIESGCGIALAEMCGLPPEVVDAARKMRTSLSKAPAFRADASVTASPAARDRYHWLLQRLALMKDASLPDSAVRGFLAQLRREVAAGDEAALVQLVAAERGSGADEKMDWESPGTETLGAAEEGEEDPMEIAGDDGQAVASNADEHEETHADVEVHAEADADVNVDADEAAGAEAGEESGAERDAEAEGEPNTADGPDESSVEGSDSEEDAAEEAAVEPFVGVDV